MSQESVAPSPDRLMEFTGSGFDKSQFVLAEYAALRAEIIKHVEVQYQLVGFNLLVFGAALSIAVQARSSATASLYPVVALFLSFCWLSATLEIQRCGAYIRDEIEGPLANGQGWEHYLARFQGPVWCRWGTWGMRGSFLATGTIAVVTSASLLKMACGRRDSLLRRDRGSHHLRCRTRNSAQVSYGATGTVSVVSWVQVSPWAVRVGACVSIAGASAATRTVMVIGG